MSKCQSSSIDNNAPPPLHPDMTNANDCYNNVVSGQGLSRSKSLNDISNDSQISAFKSDRFINLQTNNNSNIVNDQNYDTSSIEYQQQLQQNLSANLNGEYGQNLILQQQHRHHQSHLIQQQQQASLSCMPVDNSHSYDIYNQTLFTSAQTFHTNYPIHNNDSNAVFGSIQYDNNSITRNLNNNQCSKPTTQAVNGTTVFNLCNPLTINLNGVTEQIGNLHL